MRLLKVFDAVVPVHDDRDQQIEHHGHEEQGEHQVDYPFRERLALLFELIQIIINERLDFILN